MQGATPDVQRIPVAPFTLWAHAAGPRIALQKKLAIGAVNDPLEHEADRVADRVMRMPDPAPVSTSSAGANTLQRKCSCGGSGSCEECQKKKLQRSATTSAATGFAPPMVHDVLRSSGQPLDSATRSFFEPRFGYDFSAVRVHTGARAAESARAVNAAAYTVGNHMVLGASENASSPANQRLWAHELAHVLQHRSGGGGDGSSTTALSISQPGDPGEHQADRIADSVLSRSTPEIPSPSRAMLSRQPLQPGNKNTCATVCASLALIRYAVQEICQISGENDPKCTANRKKFADNESKAAASKCNCPDPRTDAEAKLPAKFPSTGIRVIGSGSPGLLGILSDCTGLPLKIDAGQVLQQDSASKAGKAKSATAKSKLASFLTAAGGVIVDTDPTAPAVEIGGFHGETPGYQQIDVGNIQLLAGASGVQGGLSACDAVMHEISEAVAGRQASLKPGGTNADAAFAPAHAEGIKVESAVRKELGLPLRPKDSDGDLVLVGNESPTKLVILETTIYGKGKNLKTQLTVARIVLPAVGATAGDNQVVASTVIDGEIHFKTPLEAVAVFNKYATQLGLKPIPVPVPEKKK